MKRAIVTVGLSLALLGVSSPALSQETTENLSATGGDTSTLGTGNASASPGSVTRGTTSGNPILGPDGTYHVTEVAPPSVSVTGDTGVIAPIGEPAPAPEAAPASVPVSEPAPASEPAPVASAPAAVATDDQDGDNLIDSREYELGLDPLLADADGDGVADGDEVDLYGTDPWVWDSDGDGLGDGEELFGLQSDPLVWTDASAGGQEAAVSG